MANFKIVVRKKRADGFYAVYIRVTHHRKIAFIKTEKVVNQQGIDRNLGVKDIYVLNMLMPLVSKYVEILNRVNITSWDVHDVVKYLQTGSADVCFSDYARKYYNDMFQNGQERNAKNYELAVQHLERYAGDNKIMFSDLTSTFINSWLKSLSNTSRAKETISLEHEPQSILARLILILRASSLLKILSRVSCW